MLFIIIFIQDFRSKKQNSVDQGIVIRQFVEHSACCEVPDDKSRVVTRRGNESIAFADVNISDEVLVTM